MRYFLVLALFLGGCGGAETQSQLATESSGVEREIHGFNLVETQGGQLMWKLDADYAWRIPKENKIHLEDVAIVFFDQLGAESSRLTAAKGAVDEKTGIMTAETRVKLISLQGDTLTTEELSYDKDRDRISGPGFVRLAKPDRVLTGYEFESNPDLSDYEVHRDVTITIVNRGENIETGN